jgi:RNA polymerase sigma-70 factor (ECF subfamily)
MTAAQPLQIGQYQGLSDEEVVGRVRAGDVAFYEILMRRHNQRLYRAVRAILRDENDVEDVLQEAYLAAYRNLSEFEGRARFSTWLVRIAVNRALDLRRQRAKVIAFNPEAEDGIANTIAEPTSQSSKEDPERYSARLELAHLLEDAIDALPQAFRGVYVLRDVDGMSTQEAAECLGLEINTVKTRLHRARSLLREQLAREIDEAALQAFPFGSVRCDRLVATVLDRLARGPR